MTNIKNGWLQTKANSLVMGQTTFYWTSNKLEHHFWKIKRTRTSFLEHRTNSNTFIYWWSNSNNSILASKDQTSKIEHERPSLDLLNYPSNILEHDFFKHWTDLNVLVIELKHPILGFEPSDIELRT